MRKKEIQVVHLCCSDSSSLTRPGNCTAAGGSWPPSGKLAYWRSLLTFTDQFTITCSGRPIRSLNLPKPARPAHRDFPG